MGLLKCPVCGEYGYLIMTVSKRPPAKSHPKRKSKYAPEIRIVHYSPEYGQPPYKVSVHPKVCTITRRLLEQMIKKFTGEET